MDLSKFNLILDEVYVCRSQGPFDGPQGMIRYWLEKQPFKLQFCKGVSNMMRLSAILIASNRIQVFLLQL